MGPDRASSIATREAAGRAGAAFLIVFWTTIVVVMTNDARPYAGGGWPLVASVGLGGVAILVGFLCRGRWGLVGAATGYAAAIAIQLFVLTGQSAWIAAVASAVHGFWWLPTIGGALLFGLGLIALGFLIGWGVARVIAAPTSRAERDGPVAAPVAAILVGFVVVGVLLVDASSSAYVVPDDEPTLTVEVVDGRIISVDPPSVPAGRVSLVVPGEPQAIDQQAVLTWELDAGQRAALAAGRLTASTMAALIDGTRVDLAPGTHAVVVADWTAQPPDPQTWDGSTPVLSSATFEVTSVGAATARTRGDGGPVQVAGLVVALVAYATAVAVALAWLFGPHQPRAAIADAEAGTEAQAVSADTMSGEWAIPIIVGAVSSIVLGGLALLAVDLAHNPF